MKIYEPVDLYFHCRKCFHCVLIKQHCALQILLVHPALHMLNLFAIFAVPPHYSIVIIERLRTKARFIDIIDIVKAKATP